MNIAMSSMRRIGSMRCIRATFAICVVSTFAYRTRRILSVMSSSLDGRYLGSRRGDGNDNRQLPAWASSDVDGYNNDTTDGRYHRGDVAANDAPPHEGDVDKCPWTRNEFVFGRCDLQLLLKRLIERVPFSYAHYNDGELLAMREDDGHTDRGMQRLSSELRDVMTTAFRRERPGLVFGIPCVQEFQNDLEYAKGILGNSTVERTIATVFINSNYKDARRVLLRYLKRNPDRRVHVVVSDGADMNAFEAGTDIRPFSVTRISGHNAFPKGYHDNINNTQHHMPGDIVILCAGPLGRILATEWFLSRPETTYLELGSFFDMDLYGKSFGADYYDRSGNVPHCGETTEIQTDMLLDLIERRSPPVDAPPLAVVPSSIERGIEIFDNKDNNNHNHNSVRCPWTRDEFVFSRCDLQLLLRRLIARVPFSFAHYNDGELLAMKKVDGHTDRGMQWLSSELRDVMTTAFHRERPGLVFGIPCVQEFRGDAAYANEVLGNSTVERTIATVFINSNYKDARRVLLRYVKRNPDRRVHVVVSDEADMDAFEAGTDIRPFSVTRISGHNAFPKGYHDNINNTQHHMPGDIVILCAGPLGRILATEWFLSRPETTYLELGSFFDMDLYGKSFGANYYNRSGNVPHCGETTEIQTDMLLDLIDKPLLRRRR